MNDQAKTEIGVVYRTPKQMAESQVSASNRMSMIPNTEEQPDKAYDGSPAL